MISPFRLLESCLLFLPLSEKTEDNAIKISTGFSVSEVLLPHMILQYLHCLSNLYIPTFFFPSLPSFLSFLPFFPSLFYLFIKVYCKPFNLVAFSIQVSAAYPKFVLSIEYSTVRSAKSVLNLVLLLSRLIHKFRLLGLTRFIMGYQKSSSDEHDCTWKL